ncbi:hypothetical protein PMAYCL1PPCAC_10700, partial [Pristionchus mayeri]
SQSVIYSTPRSAFSDKMSGLPPFLFPSTFNPYFQSFPDPSMGPLHIPSMMPANQPNTHIHNPPYPYWPFLQHHQLYPMAPGPINQLDVPNTHLPNHPIHCPDILPMAFPDPCLFPATPPPVLETETKPYALLEFELSNFEIEEREMGKEVREMSKQVAEMDRTLTCLKLDQLCEYGDLR